MGPNIGPRPGPGAKMRGPPDPPHGSHGPAHFGPGSGLGPNIWAHGPILPSVVAYWPVKSQIPGSVRSLNQIRSDQIRSDHIKSPAPRHCRMPKSVKSLNQITNQIRSDQIRSDQITSNHFEN